MRAGGFGKSFDKLVYDAGIYVGKGLPNVDTAKKARNLAKEVDDKIHRQTQTDRKKRSREAISGAWIHGRDDRWKFLRTPMAAPTTALAGPSGKLYSSVRDMDDIIRKFWVPLWKRHGSHHDWSDAIYALISKLLAGVLKLRPLTADDLIRRAKKSKVAGATAADAWAILELRRLPR